MKGILDKHPKVMKHLVSTLKSLNIPTKLEPIRGGTDGAWLAFKGLPTPNVSIGGENFHGKYEWVSLQHLETYTNALIKLVQEWEKTES